MINITSSRNDTYKIIHKIASSASQRRKNNLYVVEGEKIVREAIMSSQGVVKIVVNNVGLELINELNISKDIEIVLLDDELFETVSDTVNSQGIIALMKIKDYSITQINFNRVLIIDRVQDPGNVGTLIRSADAFAFDLIISLKGSCDIYNPKVVRATMGSIFHLPIVKDLTNKETLNILNNKKTTIYSTNLSHKAISIGEVNVKHPFAIVIGNESKGVSSFWIEAADSNVIIPISGNAESLNAAVAGSIIMYQFSCM